MGLGGGGENRLLFLFFFFFVEPTEIFGDFGAQKKKDQASNSKKRLGKESSFLPCIGARIKYQGRHELNSMIMYSSGPIIESGKGFDKNK